MAAFKPNNMKTSTLMIILTVVVIQTYGLPMETAQGPCPEPRTVSNFQPERLQGVWYDIKRYKNTILKGSCGTATYTWYPNNNSFAQPYKMLEFPTNTLILTKLDIPNGKFHTRVNGFQTTFDYWLLDTDYVNYHVFYTCIELVPKVVNSQSINILSRKTTLDAKYLKPILENLTKNKLDVSVLQDVQQDNTVCKRNSGR